MRLQQVVKNKLFCNFLDEIGIKIRLLLQSLYVFLRGDLLFFAASLSFYTIFAILPMAVVIFSILAVMPNFQGLLEEFKVFIIGGFIPSYSDIFLEYLDSFLKGSKALGGIGFFYAFVTSILFFRNYQFITAKIYRVKPKSFWDSIAVYWTLMTLFPLGIFFSIYLSTKIYTYLEDLGFQEYVVWLLRLVPYLITWLVFFIAFKVSANMAASTKNIIFSSFITSMLWSFCKWGFVYYVFYNKAYLTLYGSFSIIMFLFVWIYISWMILLFGMSLSRGLSEVLTKEDMKE